LTRIAKLLIVGAVVGVLLVVLGVVLERVAMKKLDSGLQSSVPIVNRTESKSLPGWSKPSLPIYMKFHFFNVTNTDDVIDKGAKPNVIELGPYVYRERREKDNLFWNEDSTRVNYTEKIFYHFEPTMSSGSLDDVVSVYDLPFVTTVTRVNIAKKTNRKLAILPLLMNGKAMSLKIKLFTHQTVNDLLWGYDSKILQELRKMPQARDKIKSAKFGLFLNKNGTEGSPMSIGTGIDDLDDLAQVKTWEGKEALDFWYTDAANAINGTDGSMFHPGISSSENVFMFSPDLCRSLEAEFKGKEEIHGITTYKYSPTKDVFAGPDENPSNAAFCYPSGKAKDCLGKGLLRVSTCKKMAPLVVSSPHLLGTDATRQQGVVGLQPNEAIHVTTLNIEPLTGLLLKAKKRIQYNVLIEKIAGQGIFKKVNSGTVVPLFWVEEGFEAPAEFAAKLKNKVINSINLVNSLMIALVAIGAMILLGCLIAVFVSSDKIFDRQASLHTSEMKPVATNPPEADNFENGTYKANEPK